jgi:hypothetical protein
VTPDTTVALVLAAGTCLGLIGLLAGGLVTWWLCSANLSRLCHENHHLRRRLLEREGKITRSIHQFTP